MRKTTFRLFRLLLLTTFLILGTSLNLYSQQVASEIISETHVDNSENATVINDSYAQINSYGGALFGAGSYDGALELGFTGTVSPNTTAFTRINFDEDILNVLLQGSLGELIADLTGSLILGNHYFTVSAKMDDSEISSYSTDDANLDKGFRIVVDENSNFFITHPRSAL